MEYPFHEPVLFFGGGRPKTSSICFGLTGTVARPISDHPDMISQLSQSADHRSVQKQQANNQFFPLLLSLPVE